MTIISQVIYRIKSIAIKIPMTFLIEVGSNPNGTTKFPNSQRILEQKEQSINHHITGLQNTL